MLLSGFENISIGSTSKMLAHLVALPKVERNQVRLWIDTWLTGESHVQDVAKRRTVR